MKKVVIVLGASLTITNFFLYSMHDDATLESLQAVLDIESEATVSRAPSPPSTLGASLGNMIFQGYNGGTTNPYTQGANVGGYSALPTPTTPTPNQTFPANIIVSTVPSSGGTGTARLSVQSNGFVGIGNFAPADTTLANAALNVEGTTTTVANSMVHLGSRTTGLTGFTSMTGATSVNYSEQIDGNLLVTTKTLTNNATTPGTFNLLPATFIRQRNLTTATYVISNPGVYCLAENISFSPATGIPAISITASNVVLDFQGYSITQTNATANVDGITIASAASDIMVSNGRLSSFTRNGILTGNNLNRIAFQDLTITNCASQAISSVGAASPRNDSLYINNCIITACNSILIQNWNNVFLNTVSVAQSTATTGAISFNTCADIIGSKIVCNNSTSASSFIGLSLNTISGAQFGNCAMISNAGGTAASSGVFIAASSGITFDKAYILNNSATSGDLAGFLIDGDKCVFTNCVVAGGSSAGNVYGFRINNTSAKSTIIKDSFIYNNISSGVAAVANGISLGANIAQSLFAGNIIHSQSNTGGGTATGITFTSSAASVDNMFFNNTVFNNLTTGINYTNGGGSTQFVKNLSTRNATNYSAGLIAGSVQTSALNQIAVNLTCPWVNISFT